MKTVYGESLEAIKFGLFTAAMSEANTTNNTRPEGKNAVQQNVTNENGVPTNDLQFIIDKVASYVAKYGEKFEETARKRQNPKYKFLEPGDCFNAYYNNKLKQYITTNHLEQTAPSISNVYSETNSKLSVCHPLKNQIDSKALEIKSSLEDGSNKMSDNEHKKNQSEISKIIYVMVKSSTGTLNKNSLKNTEKLAKERLKDKLALAVKEKLIKRKKEEEKIQAQKKLYLAVKEKLMLHKKKEKIEAEMKRKAARFLASKKKISLPSDSLDRNPAKIHVNQTLVSYKQKCFLLNDTQYGTRQTSPPKVYKNKSICSSGENMPNDVLSNKNIGENKSKLNSTRDERRKRLENYGEDRDYFKRIKRHKIIKEKSPDRLYSSHDKYRSRRCSRKSHSSHHSSSKDHKIDHRSSRRSKH